MLELKQSIANNIVDHWQPRLQQHWTAA